MSKRFHAIQTTGSVLFLFYWIDSCKETPPEGDLSDHITRAWKKCISSCEKFISDLRTKVALISSIEEKLGHFSESKIMEELKSLYCGFCECQDILDERYEWISHAVATFESHRNLQCCVEVAREILELKTILQLQCHFERVKDFYKKVNIIIMMVAEALLIILFVPPFLCSQASSVIQSRRTLIDIRESTDVNPPHCIAELPASLKCLHTVVENGVLLEWLRKEFKG